MIGAPKITAQSVYFTTSTTGITNLLTNATNVGGAYINFAQLRCAGAGVAQAAFLQTTAAGGTRVFLYSTDGIHVMRNDRIWLPAGHGVDLNLTAAVSVWGLLSAQLIATGG
ncbi:hypothetical protein [Methylibium sp.]|uniref:hypothetical protein n=1 Tax=Methylibium sp. TaxID=2067992 RepID=UPI0017CA951C|nr:hypothetical protein [Methylibium sp.]MBA3590480.1 hypothetical protein [Methylibium sp.]